MEVLFPGSSATPRKFPLHCTELHPETRTIIGPLAVTSFPVVHPSGAPAYALRVECGGKVLAYSGDTEWTDALMAAARGADLFICEAYYFEKKVKYHLAYQTLLDKRPDLACRRMILTHMSEDMLRRLPDVDAEWAEDGKTFTV